ncbi:PREDICTED: transmembrane protein 251-like [Priapulus caudatus]|uniref:Lysosomal enzyme trafficking factor n=1 Tax=Priapulus caudatus TaxID=37621 RepID=A0ABM1EDE5_PRICU|nr:PREDICTED: transmembrane protein 251-like [Priapulus caudatus]
MHFRQRIAWMILLFYLAATAYILYFIFEISDSYNILALDHIEKFHQSHDATYLWPLSSMWRHLADIPFPLWSIVFGAFYLQVFCTIFAYTKADPKLVFVWMLPVSVYWNYKRWRDAQKDNESVTLIKAGHNGHIIQLDT